MTPTIYIIAGPNGAGKTTFATSFLPKFAQCREFLNADLIAAGLSPFDPDSQALRASELLLKRIDELVSNVQVRDGSKLPPTLIWEKDQNEERVVNYTQWNEVQASKWKNDDKKQ